MSIKRIKIVAIISFISIALALLIAHGSPTKGYELSIYDSTPWQTWLLLSIGLVCGAFIIINQAVIMGSKKSKNCMIGIIILIYTKASLLLVPYIRGYMGWSGDHLTHFGYIKDIIQSGHIALADGYPATHLLSFSIISVTGSDILISNMFTVAFSILFVIFTFLLAATVLPHPEQHVIAAMIASLIIIGAGYNIFLMPNGWSIFLLPLIFYLYFKSKMIGFRALFIIFLIISPIFHPLTSLILIISMIILEFQKYIIYIRFKVVSASNDEKANRPSVIYVLLGLVSFLPWVLSFQFFKINLRVMWMQITTGLGSDPMGDIGNSLNKVAIHGFDFFILLLKMYGAAIVLSIFITIGIYQIIKGTRKKGSDLMAYVYMSLVSIFLLTGSLYVAYLIGIPGLDALAGERVLFYAEILMPVLAAPAIFSFIKSRRKYGCLLTIAIFWIIIFSSAASIISLYPSPEIYRPNAQVSESDLNGMTWFITEKDKMGGCYYIMEPPYRYSDAIIGKTETQQRTDIKTNSTQLPDHFGFNGDDKLGERISNNNYVIIPEVDKKRYTTVWKEVGRYNDNDFDRLSKDVFVMKVYSNGGVDVYYT